MVLLVVLAAGAGAGYIYLVGFAFGADDPRARAVTDALGPGLLVVATFALLVALVVAARGQWLRERMQRYRELTDSEEREHAERVRAHDERVAAVQQREQEQIARSREEQAAERATSETLMRGIEQLGSEQPAIRIGGLAVLERLGQQHPEYRQPVADVVCGYLRLPSGPSAVERSVRQTAQRLLLRHASPADRRSQWRGVRFDLSGADLVDFDATRCALSAFDFSGAKFSGVTSFADCVLDGTVRLAGARFGAVSFHGARLASGAFERVTFEGAVEFDLAEFAGAVAFERALFDSDATFVGTRFGETVMFADVDFSGATSFHGTAFEGDVALMRTLFRGPVSFAEATLGGHSWFEDVRATAAYTHIFPPGYREARVDDAWSVLEYAAAAAAPASAPPTPTTHARADSVHADPDAWPDDASEQIDDVEDVDDSTLIDQPLDGSETRA